MQRQRLATVNAITVSGQAAPSLPTHHDCELGFLSSDMSPHRRCKTLHHSLDPRLRIALLFVAAVALTALCIAIPWLPYSPWNKPIHRFGMVEVRHSD